MGVIMGSMSVRILWGRYAKFIATIDNLFLIYRQSDMSVRHSYSVRSSLQRIGDYSYSPADVIGQGSFSTVYKGYSLLTGEKVAVKIVNLKGAQQQEVMKNIKNQLYVLSHLPPHPNILRCIHLEQQGNSVFIISELCEEKLDGNKIKDVELNRVISGIIKGFKHLFKHGVVHRDIKLQNIMLKKGVPKIIDFGFAKVISNPSDIMVEQLGTPVYMSPQLLQKKFYTSKCDIWSLGVLFYQLLYHISPFPASNLKQLVERVKSSSPIIYKGHNSLIQKLIEKCLVKDQGRRLSWKGLFDLGDELVKSDVKEPESVYEYILQFIGADDKSPGSCWPSFGRRSTML